MPGHHRFPVPSSPRPRTRWAGRAAPAPVVRLAVVACGAALLAACAPGSDRDAGAPVGTASSSGIETNAVVARLVDGDTLVATVDGRDEKVRLIGIDTPETHKPGTPVECFGREAAAHLAELAPAGTPVRLERDVDERDRYDRLLAYMWRADGTFVNLAMASDGFAAQLTIPPNVAHADEFGAATARAREQGRGLWGRCEGPHATTIPS